MSDQFEGMLTRAFGARMKTENPLCQEIWSALANVTWYHPASKEEAGYSFRAAGGLIAEIRGSGDYMDWYCSGPYASITDEIRRTFKKEGWIADDISPICQAPGCLRDAGCIWPKDGSYYSTCGEHMRDQSWVEGLAHSSPERSEHLKSSPTGKHDE